ncbi:MAG: ATP-binding cassette domain-containing protein [Demequinaceae bacterium]|nr:ATP-binding cassette domain-containing protein [Demequinaceae bacterium]
MRLVARGVTFSYPRSPEPVLKGVDFDIPSGHSAAIIGPSGSGKTTLLSLIGRLLSMQEGTVEAIAPDGTVRPPYEVASWVFQTISLLPDRTAADNVAIGAYSDGATREEAQSRARDYLGRVGLTPHAEIPTRILSGGEAQRVAIARALASHRPVILADEPTGQLDAKTSASVLEAMIGAHGERTVLVVTHDPEVADRCDLILELRDGRVHELREGANGRLSVARAGRSRTAMRKPRPKAKVSKPKTAKPRRGAP